MRKNNYIKLILLLIMGISIFSACEKKYVLEDTVYRPTPATSENVNLKYNTPMTVPFPTPHSKIVSDTPTFVVDGAYIFGIDTITASEGANFKNDNFSIDAKYGVITYENKKGELKPGNYYVSVSLVNATGFAIVESAYEMIVEGEKSANKKDDQSGIEDDLSSSGY